MDFDYSKLWPYFLRAAASVGVPDVWLEDCAQEFAVAVWKAPANIYIPTIARRQAIDFRRNGLHAGGVHLRRSGRDIRPDSSLEALAEIGVGFASGRFENTAAARLDLEKAWPLLTRKQHRVLLLYGVGYTWREIGDRLGVTETRACQVGQEARRLLLVSTRLEPLSPRGRPLHRRE